VESICVTGDRIIREWRKLLAQDFSVCTLYLVALGHGIQEKLHGWLLCMIFLISHSSGNKLCITDLYFS
jgi:hypothetical protein